MRKLIFMLFAILSLGLSIQAQEPPLAKADKLFAARDQVDSLKQAIAMMDELRAKDQTNYEAFWRLAKFKYYLADQETDSGKKTKLYEAAIEAAKKAVALDGNRVEGHFWLGACDGEYADLKGALSSIGLVKTIRKEFEAALSIDPMYENGAAYLALGQMDLSLPRIFGGSDKRGLDRLEQGAQAAPTNIELKLALAEAYEKKGRKDDARKLLESIATTNDPARSPKELIDLRNKARQRLDKMK